MTSPPARVASAHDDCRAIVSLTNRTDPSARAKVSPPGWLLRKEYRVGHRFLLAAVSNPRSGSGILFPVLGGMAHVPHAPLGSAHSFQWQYAPMSSPIMRVLLVPSVMFERGIFPYRMSARQKMPSPFSRPFC